MYEYERKFLVKKFPNDINFDDAYIISQTYLSISNDIEICIRRTTKLNNVEPGKDVYYTLIIKSGFGNERNEQVIYIDAETYLQLSLLTNTKGYRPLTKVRYLKESGSQKLSIDLFVEQEFYLAEVEFNEKEDMDKFKPYDWMGEEVTNNKNYYNKNIWKEMQAYIN